jgi:hypothetical protein
MILPSATYILVLGRRHFDVDSGVVRDNILLFRVQRRLVLSRLFSFLKEHLPDLAGYRLDISCIQWESDMSRDVVESQGELAW